MEDFIKTEFSSLKYAEYLSPKEREVCDLRYDEMKTLQCVGDTLGITRERVRQILERIAQKWYKNNESSILFFMTHNYYDSYIQMNDLNKENKYFKYFIIRAVPETVYYNKDKGIIDSLMDSRIETTLKKIESKVSKKLRGNTITESQKVFEDDENAESILKILNYSTTYKVKSGKIYNVKKMKGRTRNLENVMISIFTKHGEPLHHSQIKKDIELMTLTGVYNKKASTSYILNTLIDKDRFVLVGRGMYGLKEWGYDPRVAKDVVFSIVKEKEVATFDEVKEIIKTKKIIKDSTVYAYLHNDDRIEFIGNKTFKVKK